MIIGDKYKVIIPDEHISGIPENLVGFIVDDCFTAQEAMNTAISILPALKGRLDPKLVYKVETV